MTCRKCRKRVWNLPNAYDPRGIPSCLNGRILCGKSCTRKVSSRCWNLQKQTNFSTIPFHFHVVTLKLPLGCVPCGVEVTYLWRALLSPLKAEGRRAWLRGAEQHEEGTP